MRADRGEGSLRASRRGRGTRGQDDDIMYDYLRHGHRESGDPNPLAACLFGLPTLAR